MKVKKLIKRIVSVPKKVVGAYLDKQERVMRYKDAEGDRMIRENFGSPEEYEKIVKPVRKSVAGRAVRKVGNFAKKIIERY
jgi:hypothetical protein